MHSLHAAWALSACNGTLQGTFTGTLTGGIRPPPVLSTILPATASRGQTVKVTIQGQNTNFSRGTTQVSAGPGIAVTNVAVVDATHLNSAVYGVRYREALDTTDRR